jgi:hypothetical protein
MTHASFALELFLDHRAQHVWIAKIALPRFKREGKWQRQQRGQGEPARAHRFAGSTS